MSNASKPRQSYPKAFKLEAIRLMTESDRASSEIAAELGVRRNQLYKWKEQLESKGEESLTSKRGRPRKSEESVIKGVEAL